MFTSAIQRFETLRAMCTEVSNKHHMLKKNNFHWLVTTVVYQQVENSERANQIYRFAIDHCKFILKLDRNTENMFSIIFKNYRDENQNIILFELLKHVLKPISARSCFGLFSIEL